MTKKPFRLLRRLALLLLLSISFAAPRCPAQSSLTLAEAVARALDGRASLKAEAQRIPAAQGRETQARLLPNPTFQFENQNLGPTQTYTRGVDTYAYLTQPLDILGKRGGRIAVANKDMAGAQADYELVRRQIAQAVKRAYWAARGTQGVRDLLNATVDNFQKIVDYHSAQLSAGAIAEQDFLRIRLEGERLKITANLAARDATRARVELERQMGRIDFPDLILSEPLDETFAAPATAETQQVLAQRVEVRAANAALDAARARAHLEDLAARPDLSIEAGYKRTELADTTRAANTALAGFSITLPVVDRNQGNRAAANAEVTRQQQLVAEAQAGVLADYYAALEEFRLRSREVGDTLQPLRQHAVEISRIAQQAYAQNGIELLRLLDAERAELDAQVAWLQGMVEYQQSIVNLEYAEGVAP